MSIIMYKVEENQLVKCQDKVLDPERNYIIIDKHMKRPKIWVWRGPNSNVKDRYFVGVSATVIKTQEALYGSSIEVIEGGSEPEQFPKLDEAQYIEPTEEEFNKISSRLKIQPTDTAETEMEQIKETIENEVEQSMKKPSKIIEEADTTPIESEEIKVSELVTEEIENKPARKSGKLVHDKDSDVILRQKLKMFLHNMSKSLEQLQSKIDKFLEEI
jgi:hypothetical protein